MIDAPQAQPVKVTAFSRRRLQCLAIGLVGIVAGSFACKATPELEPAGEAPPFHDQHLLTRGVVARVSADEMPARLAVDVRADTIELDDSQSRLIFPRHRGELSIDNRTARVIQVPGNDQFSVWLETTSSGHHRVLAARADAPSAHWLVLEYSRVDAVAEPIVVGDRVAIMTADELVHAPLTGGPSRTLSLGHTPKGRLSSHGGRLVWVAERDGRELVLSTDASFTDVSIEYERPRHEGELVAAVLVGGSLVLASIDWVHDARHELVVRRKRADGAMLELVRAPVPGDELRLLADGSQAWLYIAESLWWIGESSHAKISEFDAELSAIGADDGLLLWQVEDGVHVAGQPTPEFREPFVAPLAIGGDDADLWADPPTDTSPARSERGTQGR